MAVEINDDKSLEINARINLEQFRRDANEIAVTLTKLGGGTIDFDIENITGGFEKISELIWALREAYYAIGAEQSKLTAAHSADIIGIEKYSKSLDSLLKKQSELKDSINDLAQAAGSDRFDQIGDSIVKGGAKLLTTAFPELKPIDNLFPGLIEGVSGLVLDPIVNPIMDYLKELDLFNEKANTTEEANKNIAAEMGSAGEAAALATLQVEHLKEQFIQARGGILSKTDALQQYNNTIGKTLGYTNDFNVAEQRVITNGNAFIELMFMKGEAAAMMNVYVKNMSKASEELAKTDKESVDFMLSGLPENSDIYKKNAKKNRNENAKPYEDNANLVKRKILDKYREIDVYAKVNNLNAQNTGGENNNNITKPDVNYEEKFQSALKRRINLINSIAKLSDNYSKRYLTQEDQQAQAIRSRFEEARNQLIAYNKWINTYNKNAPKSKQVKEIDITQLNESEDNVIAANTYHQDTENLKIEIEKQKKIFEEYEQYKLNFGSQKADERYSADLKGFSSYADYLKSMLALNMAGSFGQPTNVVNERNILLATSAGAAEEAENKKRQNAHDEALLAASTLEENIDRIKREYAAKGIALGKDLTDERKAKLLEDRDNAIEAAQREAVKKQEIFSILYNDLDSYSKASALQRIADAKQEAESQLESGKITEKVYKELIDLVSRSEQAVNNRFYEGLINMGQAIGQIGQSLSGANGEFGAFINGLGSLLSQVGNAQKLVSDFGKAKESEKFEAGTAVAVAGIGAAVSLIGIFTSSAKQRKQAEKEYYNSVLKSQKEYNLSLNEQIRLRSILDENVFVKDYKGRMADGTIALTDANNKFLDSLEELQQGRAKVGKRSKVDSNSLLGGAAAGAILGTIVPGVGNLVGGVVGGIVGAIAGLFGGKKKKDVFGGLLQEYPELIQKATDGTIKFNDALANNLIQNNLVDDKTKILLQNTTDLANARKAALEQINGVISDLSGNLGDNLRSSLVDAFREGEDSAKAFGNTVEGVLENIVSQMLFSAVFGDDLSTLQDEMKKSFDIDGDQSFVDDIIRFFDTAGGKISLFNNGLEEAQQRAEERGLNLFGKEEQDTSALSSKTIQASLTEDTANRALGIWNGMFDINKRQLAGIEAFNVSLLAQQSIAMDGLRSWQAIEMNTANTVVRLDSAITELKAINKNTGGMSSRDMGV